MHDQLVSTHHAQTYRLALILTKNPRDAEEVTHEAFATVLARHAQRPDAEIRRWLIRTTVNLATLRLRKHRTSQQSLADDLLPRFFESGRLERPQVDWSARADQDGAGLTGQVHASVDALPEKFRWILLMRDVEDLSTQEIADALGMSLGAVKSTLHRARMFVREALNHYYEEQAA